MKKIKEFLELFIIAIILILVVWFIFFKKGPEPKIEYVYKTITTRIPKPYAVPEPYPITTPPITITEYLVDSLVLDSLQVILQDQILIITGLQDSIRIHENFFKMFLKNPKLLSVDLKRDTFQIGLFEISGITNIKTWPIDLNYFSYRWSELDGFSRIEIKPTVLPLTLKEPFANYYVGGAVDMWHRMPQFTMRVEKQLSSVRLYIDTRLGLLDVNKSSLSVGIEYQINVKNHP